MAFSGDERGGVGRVCGREYGGSAQDKKQSRAGECLEEVAGRCRVIVVLAPRPPVAREKATEPSATPLTVDSSKQTRPTHAPPPP